MNRYTLNGLIAITIYAVFMFGIFALNKQGKLKVKSRDGSKKKRSASAMRNKIAKDIEAKASIDKRYEMEAICMQAGVNMNYGQLKVWSLVCAVVLPILIMILIDNMLLAIGFSILGFFLPVQLVKKQANKRVLKMEDQVGSFIRMIIERYKSNKDVTQSILDTLPDFRGYEPFYSQLQKSVVELNIGTPCEDVLKELSRSTGSPYLVRFTNYYKSIGTISTHEAKVDLLNQAFIQYEEKRRIKILLKKEIAGPVRDAYIMVIATPLFMIYQCATTDGYLDYLLNEDFGKIGLAIIIISLTLCSWFINSAIGKPLD